MVERSKTDIAGQSTTLLPDNTTREISPADVRSIVADILDSYLNTSEISAGDFAVKSGTAGVSLSPNLRQNSTTGEIEALTKAIFNPAMNIGSTELAATGNILRLTSGSNIFLPVGAAVTTSGTGAPLFVSLGAFGPLPAGANQTATDTTSVLTPGQTMEFTVTVAVGVNHVTAESDVRVVGTGTVRLQIFKGASADLANLMLDQTVALTNGLNTIQFDGWGLFEAGESTFVRYTNVGAANLTLEGTGVGAAFRPYSVNRGYSYSVGNLEDQLTNIRTLEQFQDTVAAMLTGGTHNGVTVTYDDTNGVINLDVTGTTPPITPSPALSAFSIPGLPSSVDNGASLNQAYTVSFTTQGTSQITALNLTVTGAGNNSTFPITVPSADGAHSVSVTLSGIITTTDGTIAFQIRGTTSAGATIMSSTQNVTVRTSTADEFAYYGVSTTNNAATIDTGTLTSVNVQAAGTSYDIDANLPANNFLIILEPSDRAITSIIERTFNVESLNRFTRTTNVRTINGQQYDTYVLENNGPSGDVSFRVTHA